jgi:hypothetical protein
MSGFNGSANASYFYVTIPTLVCQRCGQPDTVVIPRQLLEKARLLTHPDLHEASPKRLKLATKVTAAINAVLDS